MAFYNGWENLQNLYSRRGPGCTLTFCKHFMNFSAVNHWDVVVSLQKVGGCTQAKIRTFALFPPESIHWSSTNFQKMQSD